MKKIIVFAMLCLCISAFAQENATPSAGSFGLSVRMAVLNDFLPGMEFDLFRTPGVGVGMRYHLADRMMMELILSGGYIIENRATSPDRDFISLGGGLGAYYWMRSKGSLSPYMGTQVLVYVYDTLDSDARVVQVVGSLQFGMQYNFSSNFAVFGNFGVGGGLFSDRNASDELDSRSHIQILPPQVGIVFYF